MKEVVHKYALFFIQKGLTLNLHDLDKIIVTDKKWLLVVIEQILSKQPQIHQGRRFGDLYGGPGALYQGYGNRDKKIAMYSESLNVAFQATMGV